MTTSFKNKINGKECGLIIIFVAVSLKSKWELVVNSKMETTGFGESEEEVPSE